MRALDNLDHHLLGRRPMPADKRDYRLGDYLAAHQLMVDRLTVNTSLGQLATLGLTEWASVYAFWAWYKQNVLATKPPPPAPDTAVNWKIGAISDQGQTGHCVGFTGLDWGNSLPVFDNWPNQVGHDIYYECKVLEGEPKAEDGSDSRSLCKALRNRGRIGAYAFAKTPDEAASFVLRHGPVGIGVDWYNDMFEPKAPDYVLQLSGDVAGGHEVMLSGYDPATDLFRLVNHWGADWGDGGCAYLRHVDLDRLLHQQGDCWAGLENPL